MCLEHDWTMMMNCIFTVHDINMPIPYGSDKGVVARLIPSRVDRYDSECVRYCYEHDKCGSNLRIMTHQRSCPDACIWNCANSGRDAIALHKYMNLQSVNSTPLDEIAEKKSIAKRVPMVL